MSNKYCSETSVGSDKSPPAITYANLLAIFWSCSEMYLECSIESVPTKNMPKACLPNTFTSLRFTGCVYPLSAINFACAFAVAICLSLLTTIASFPFCNNPKSNAS